MCETFEAELEELEPADDELLVRLRAMAVKLSCDSVEHLLDHIDGEVPALMERCRRVVAALNASAEDRDDRWSRYNARQEVIDLARLVHTIALPRDGTKRVRDANAAALRTLVSSALSDFVEAEE